MNLLTYQAECQNTKSDKFFGERVSKLFFFNAVTVAIEALQRLDAIKKSLFYGKSSADFPVNGEAHQQGAIVTCNELRLDKLHSFPQPALDILHAIIGKATESAELLEALKLAVIDGQPLDRINLIEEIGDGFWYDGIALEAVASNFHDAAARNNAKLKKRFPNKFTTQDAKERDLDAERATLEDRSKESAGDMLARLGDDGDLWAEEFVSRLKPGQLPLDVDTMRAWFCNAIEAGASAGRAAEQQIWLSDNDDGRDRYIRTFLGWLSGEVCELHSVEVPKLAAAFEKFKAQYSGGEAMAKAIFGADERRLNDKINEENAG